MTISTARFSFGSIACAAVLAAMTLQAGAASAHQCPKGSYWGRTYTIHKCGNKWCTKYSAWHCIKKLPKPG